MIKTCLYRGFDEPKLNDDETDIFITTGSLQCYTENVLNHVCNVDFRDCASQAFTALLVVLAYSS